MGTRRNYLAGLALCGLWACGDGDSGPVAPIVDEPDQQQVADSGAPGVEPEVQPPVADPVDQNSADGPLADNPPQTGPEDGLLDDNPPPNAPEVQDETPILDDIIEDSGVVLPPPHGANASLEGTFLDIEEFPMRQIVSGGVPKDGIPALTNPSFVAPSRVNYLAPDDIVLGVYINGEAKAYPHNIGWWHEIVNDRIGGQPISVTFCPLTGTGLVFDAYDENTGRQIEFGVSGLLFNNNLIMYDRRDGSSIYPQIIYTAVSGPRQYETLELLPVVETTWEMWQRLHPNTLVIERGGYPLDQYTVYPYGPYRTDDNYLIFALLPSITLNANNYASLFGEKDRVLGVRLDGATRAYPFELMGSRRVINDQLGGVDIVVAWDRRSRLAVPFAREVDGQVLTFDINTVQGTPFSMVDRETQSRWLLTGLAVDGPLEGKRLTQVPAHNSFWFAWVTFWQNTEVWAPEEG